MEWSDDSQQRRTDMRKFLLRGTMVLFVSAMGFLGNGGQLGLSTLSLSIEPQSASARMVQDPLNTCDAPGRITPCDGQGPDPWGIAG
jgi:hypothetical protein